MKSAPGPGGPSNDLRARHQLNQVARDEARGRPGCEYLPRGPGRSRHEPRADADVCSRSLHAGIEADDVAVAPVDALVDIHEGVDRQSRARCGRHASPRSRTASDRRRGSRTASDRGPGRRHSGTALIRLGPEEELNGLITVISATRSTSTRRCASLFQKHQPGEIIPVRVLLPIDIMLLRPDAQAVAQDRRAAVRAQGADERSAGPASRACGCSGYVVR